MLTSARVCPAHPFVRFDPLGAKMNPLKWLNGFKCTHQNQSSNTLYFDYVSTTNECIDLSYIATICQDMYEKSMSLGIVTIPCTFLKVAKHGKLRQNKAF